MAASPSTTIIPIKVSEPASFTDVHMIAPNIRETTNDFTRKTTGAKTKHWKGSVEFTRPKGDVARVFRIENVIVTTNPTKNPDYGVTYAYVGIPAYVREFFSREISKHATCNLNEARFEEDPNHWWKVVNNVSELATVIRSDGESTSLNVAEVLKSTAKSFAINAELAFEVKYKTTDGGKYIAHTSPLEVTVDVIRGVIRELNVDVGPPKSMTSSKKISSSQIQTKKADTTPDDVLKMLSQLNLN